MRDNIGPAALGTVRATYDHTSFQRVFRDIEIWMSQVLSKGPIRIGDLVADTLTVAGILVEGQFTGTVLGRVSTPPSEAVVGVGLNVGQIGVPPDLPQNGDLWTTSAGWFVVLEGVTHQLAFTDDPTFTGLATFDDILVTGAVAFTSLTISGTLTTGNLTVSGSSSFAGATFSALATFATATFSGLASFATATFSGLASFATATFSGLATFADATFSGIVSFAAKVSFAPSTAAGAGINIGTPHVSPSAPVDGDFWYSGGFLNYRQAGTTFVAVNTGNTQTISGAKTFSGVTTLSGASNVVSGRIVFNASDATRHRLNLAHSSTVPAAPVNGDMWSTSAGLFIHINGVTKTVTLT